MTLLCFCGSEISISRYNLGYRKCLKCGDIKALEERNSWSIVPMHKGNYMPVLSKKDLIGINNKGGIVK